MRLWILMVFPHRPQRSDWHHQESSVIHPIINILSLLWISIFWTILWSPVRGRLPLTRVAKSTIDSLLTGAYLLIFLNKTLNKTYKICLINFFLYFFCCLILFIFFFCFFPFYLRSNKFNPEKTYRFEWEVSVSQNIDLQTVSNSIFRFVTALDQLDARVEKFRKDALGLQEKRDFLLLSIDLIKSNDLLQDMRECKYDLFIDIWYQFYTLSYVGRTWFLDISLKNFLEIAVYFDCFDWRMCFVLVVQIN